jgi:phosphoribosylaminoimidazole-succinocarboxamide synthase
VRDSFDLGDHLLMVATDRISAFDVVLPTPIPRKGEILSRLSAWWFERTRAVVPNHFVALLSAETAGRVPFPVGPEYFGRSMIVRKAEPIAAECIARGYITGSGWKEYVRSGTVCGIPLPEGLAESAMLPSPIFTPSTKAAAGHDENISFEQLAEAVGEDAANVLRVRTLATYGYGQQAALERGIIIADTKFEFGYRNEEIILIDEAMTPDSSRFWPLDGYRAGGPQPSFDKQPLRDWMTSMGWKDGDEPPEIPADVVAATSERYMEAYRRITGEELPE